MSVVAAMLQFPFLMQLVRKRHFFCFDLLPALLLPVLLLVVGWLVGWLVMWYHLLVRWDTPFLTEFNDVQ